MPRIAVVIGSTRPARRSAMVAAWVHEAARERTASYDLLDLADFDLPWFDERIPPRAGRYEREHTRRWAETVAEYDAFVLVTPEYNHSVPAVLKNALDYLCAEWADKALGLVTYGVDGGVRAAEHLRQIAGELGMADVRTQVALSIFHDFEITDPLEPGTLRPGPHAVGTLGTMLDELERWAGALAGLRDNMEEAARPVA